MLYVKDYALKYKRTGNLVLESIAIADSVSNAVAYYTLPEFSRFQHLHIKGIAQNWADGSIEQIYAIDSSAWTRWLNRNSESTHDYKVGIFFRRYRASSKFG